MGKEQAVKDPYGVPMGAVPRNQWGPLMHEEPTKEQMAQGKEQNITWTGAGHDANSKIVEACRHAQVRSDIDQRNGIRSANTQQIGGEHYRKMKIQVWDFAHANNLGPIETMVVKYTSRWQNKGGIKDLRKAIHCLEKRIELALADGMTE